MYVQQTLWDTPNIISSPGSAAGRMPSDSPDGRMSGPCGPDPALASLTPRQALERGMTTRGPYGGRGAGSSISVDLQLSLASRLRRLMGVDGSPEYALTWKHWDMPSGPPICALRASARRISDKDFGGWPTPQAFDATGGGKPRPLRYKGNAPSERGNTRNPNTIGSYRGDLKDYAALAGWLTPIADDSKSDRKRDGKPDLQGLARMVSGTMQSGSPVQTERRGVLNPALSLWLMGYPDEWLSCGVRAMQSSRRSRRRS